MKEETTIQVNQSEVERIQSLIKIKLKEIFLIKNSTKYKFEETIQFKLVNNDTIDFTLKDTQLINALNAGLYSRKIWDKAFFIYKSEFESYWKRETSLDITIIPQANNVIKIEYPDMSFKYVLCYYENDKWIYQSYNDRP